MYSLLFFEYPEATEGSGAHRTPVNSTSVTVRTLVS